MCLCGFQDGVDAPPEEELPADLAEDADFSFATMFAAQVSLQDSKEEEQPLTAAPQPQHHADGSASTVADPWTVFPGSAAAESLFAQVRRRQALSRQHSLCASKHCLGSDRACCVQAREASAPSSAAGAGSFSQQPNELSHNNFSSAEKGLAPPFLAVRLPGGPPCSSQPVGLVSMQARLLVHT